MPRFPFPATYGDFNDSSENFRSIVMKTLWVRDYDTAYIAVFRLQTFAHGCRIKVCRTFRHCFCTAVNRMKFTIEVRNSIFIQGQITTRAFSKQRREAREVFLSYSHS